jgi:hypothetical protein
MQDLEERLARWRRAGLITGSQADSIRAYERARPRAEGPGRPPPPPPPPPPPRRYAARPPQLRPPGDLGDRAGPLLDGLPFAPLDARLVGLAMALLAAIGFLAGVFRVTLDLLVAPTHDLTGDLEDLLHLGASVLGAVGGFQMAMGSAAGRRLVLASLGINLGATLVLSLKRLAEAGTLIEIGLWVALALLVATSAFGRSARPVRG